MARRRTEVKAMGLPFNEHPPWVERVRVNWMPVNPPDVL